MRGSEKVIGNEADWGLDRELPPLISVTLACKLLGVGKASGYRAAANGDLPTIRWGRRLYVPTARLRAIVGEESGRAR